MPENADKRFEKLDDEDVEQVTGGTSSEEPPEDKPKSHYVPDQPEARRY